MSTSSQRHPGAPRSAADEALRAALRWGIAGLVVLVIVATTAGGIFAGTAGVWGALIGAAIGGFFILTTVMLVLFTAKLDTGIQGMVMLGSWIGKLLVVMIVVAAIKHFDFYSRPTLFCTVVGALLIVLGAETYGLLRQRVPIVDLPAGSADQDR